MRRLARHETAAVATMGAVVDGWAALVDAILVPIVRRELGSVRHDAPADVEQALQRLRDALLASTRHQADELDDTMRAIGAGVADTQLDTFSAAVGVDRDALVRLLELRGVTTDEQIDEFAAQTVDLITSKAEELHDSIRLEVLESYQAGERWEDLSDRLQERLGVAESSADLIAVDQIGKLNSAVGAERSQGVGITHFTWRTVGDERVRPEHEALDGQVFSYAEPPEEGLPGEPVRCRCYADPVLESELAEVAA